MKTNIANLLVDVTEESPDQGIPRQFSIRLEKVNLDGVARVVTVHTLLYCFKLDSNYKPPAAMLIAIEHKVRIYFVSYLCKYSSYLKYYQFSRQDLKRLRIGDVYMAHVIVKQ
jgi:hypothetical protein